MEVTMKKVLIGFSVFVVLALTVISCSPKSETVQQQPVVESEQSVSVPESDVSANEEPQTEELQTDQVAFPAWYSTPLTDVNTGAVFTVQENLGKIILVETLATWCSNCLRQQGEVAAFHDLLGERSDFISLGIDIDVNEDIPLLKGYVQKHGFDWLYVVANNAMIDEISALYGSQFLNPPSTPMLIIDRKGNAHPLNFGIKGAQELLDSVMPFLDESVS
jgi:hypothetical protein